MPTPPCHRETVLPQLRPRTAMDDLGSGLSSYRRVAQSL
jgi:EAL domain-containing protein (putative c-di-GMP-specific phosphodiesterase class I)